MTTPEPPPVVPKTFISYSWDDSEHKEWVKQLATRLRDQGVDVMLDHWHSAPGDQIPAFMERAVRENDFVIAICTPRFKEKSDGRGDGVGYEGDIMTAYAFTAGQRKKFIPVLRRGDWREAAPTWLVGRAMIDLSEDPYSESEYDQLLRTLHGAREAPPPIGRRPDFGVRKEPPMGPAATTTALVEGSYSPEAQSSVTIETIPHAEREIDQETIDRNAERIARILKFKASATKLPNKALSAVHDILEGIAQHPKSRCYQPLIKVRDNIQPAYKRYYLMCLILLDKVRLVQPQSRALEDVLLVYRESYLLCDRPSWKDRLAEALIEKQWSSLPIVRCFASMLRECEKVASDEVDHLDDPATFPDVRTAVARRIQLNQQHEYLDHLLEYLVRAVTDADGDTEEVQQAAQLFEGFRDFPCDLVLEPLYRSYVQNFHDRDLRGHLMKCLTGLGEPVLNHAKHCYHVETGRKGRLPHLKILGKMLSLGYPKAVQALGELAKGKDGVDLLDVARVMKVAVRRLASRHDRDERVFLTSEHLRELGRHLAVSRAEAHQQLSKELSQTIPSDELIQSYVEKVIKGTANDEERGTARLAGPAVTNALLKVYNDVNRPVLERAAAIKFLARIHGVKRRPGIGPMLWDLYLAQQAEVVKVATLQCIAELGLSPPRAMGRDFLYNESLTGSERLRDTINSCWNSIFTDVRPPSATLDVDQPRAERRP